MADRGLKTSLSWPRRTQQPPAAGRLRSVGRSIQHLLAMETRVGRDRGMAEAIGIL
jgi:hypothetical protein